MKLLRNRKGLCAMEIVILILVIGALVLISIPNIIRVANINGTDKQEETINKSREKEARTLPFVTSRMKYAQQLRIANSLERIEKSLKDLNKGVK